MDKEIVLEFIDTETGETITVKVAWLVTAPAITWHEARGYALFERENYDTE